VALPGELSLPLSPLFFALSLLNPI
jgi:hypothetical protein